MAGLEIHADAILFERLAGRRTDRRHQRSRESVADLLFDPLLGGDAAGLEARSERLIEQLSPDSSEQDHHVELAREQPLGESEGLFVAVERSLPHRRRDERVALLIANELCDFSGSPALEGKDLR